METDDFRPSDNVEDDREQSASRGMGGIPGGRGGLGIGTIIIVGLISWYFGIDPSVLLNGAQILTGNGTDTTQPAQAPQVNSGAPTDAMGHFVALVLGNTEDRWSEIFTASGRTYHPPKLRLFHNSEPGACGFAKEAMGPFYCPNDQRIYLDTAFFDDLQNKFGGCTDSKACQFSEAYVIAHEVGHHVQDELGILSRVTNAQKTASSQAQANGLQVRIELQADCFAGLWANREKRNSEKTKLPFLEAGDVDQAMQTASAIGDDRLQKEMQGYVVPDSFTHGTSEQRKRWFMNGFNSGEISACDTLSANTL
jgi:predicted metalloprotease